MKKYFVSVVLPIMALSLAFIGCSDSKLGKLKSEIAAFNAKCPQQYGAFGSLDGVTYDEADNAVVYNFTVADEFLDALSVSDGMASTKDMMLAILSLEDMNVFLTIMSDCNAGFKIVFKAFDSSKTFEFSLSADEIKDVHANPLSGDQLANSIISHMVNNNKAQCPIFVENGVTMIDVFDDGDNVVFLYELDENLYDTDVMRENFTSTRDELKKKYLSDPMVRQSGQLVSQANRGITYRYVGNISGKSVDFTLAPADLM